MQHKQLITRVPRNALYGRCAAPLHELDLEAAVTDLPIPSLSSQDIDQRNSLGSRLKADVFHSSLDRRASRVGL
jgi:hypothetical protein